MSSVGALYIAAIYGIDRFLQVIENTGEDEELSGLLGAWKMVCSLPKPVFANLTLDLLLF